MRTTKVSQLAAVSLLLLLFPGWRTARAQICNGSWTFGVADSAAYRLEAREPCHALLDPFGDKNPTLLLELGRRYEIRVVHHQTYPLELIAKGASAAQDKVLLSMGSDAGAFASDPEVDWQDDGGGTVRFTLTPRLFQAMEQGGLTAGYRCRDEAATMRGDFLVAWMPPLGSITVL
ncbi:MAG: hypothetical protein FJ280_08665 [Planctomycetes bacterium]|nr:hypothetical protein [Planctomycetota bacterium]